MQRSWRAVRDRPATGEVFVKRRPNGHSSIFKGYDGRWHGWVTMTMGAPAD